VVNTAYNIEKMVPPNDITITEATYSRIKNTEAFNFYSQIKVKGKKEPISLYTYSPLKTSVGVVKEFQYSVI
jgi:class 3 adenylate cyclase